MQVEAKGALQATLEDLSGFKRYVGLEVISARDLQMSSATVPDNPVTKFDGDWYQRMEAARKTHGYEWRTQFTPEELRFIYAAIDAECDWVQFDLPGPRRFAVMN